MVSIRLASLEASAIALIAFPGSIRANSFSGYLLSFLSTCYLSSTSFYLSSTPFCVPVFIQLCLVWNRERVALQLRAPPIDE